MEKMKIRKQRWRRVVRRMKEEEENLDVNDKITKKYLKMK
jgi:predicted nucleic acid-binding protein